METNNEILKKLKLENAKLKKELKSLKNQNVEKSKAIEYFGYLYQNTTIGLYQTNPSGEIIYANKPLVKMLGFNSLKEMQERNLEDFNLISSETRKNFKKILKQKSQIIGNEVVWYKKDASEIYVRESATAVKDDKGKTKYYVGTVEDITLQKIKEKELEENERRYKTLVDFLPEGIIVHKEGKIIYVNDCAVSYLGFENKEEVVDKSIFSIIKKKYHSLAKNRIKDVIKYNYTAKPIEQIFIKKNGTDMPVEVTTTFFPFYGTNTVISIFRDVTERKKIENELLKSKQKTELISIKREGLLRAIPDIMFTIDKKGNFIEYYANEMDNLYVAPENFINKNIKEVMPKNISEITFKHINKAIRTKKIQKYTYSLMLNNIKSFYDVRLVMIDSNSLLAIVRNVTERIELITELRKAKEKAEESNRLKSAFLSNLSHEIRTPMNVILGFAQLLKDVDIKSKEKFEYIEIIQKSGKQLIDILNDIIEMSKIEAGTVGINLTNFNLIEFIDNLHKLLKITIPKEKKINFLINNNLNNNIVLYTDKLKLQQIITNLVSNSIKYTNKGVIELGYKKIKNNIEFYVKDTGIGIEKKYHSIIFQRFRIIESETGKKIRGSGLGLSISKAYVELLGGNINLKSELKKGSTFYFTIPIDFKRKDE